MKGCNFDCNITPGVSDVYIKIPTDFKIKDYYTSVNDTTGRIQVGVTGMYEGTNERVDLHLYLMGLGEDVPEGCEFTGKLVGVPISEDGLMAWRLLVNCGVIV